MAVAAPAPYFRKHNSMYWVEYAPLTILEPKCCSCGESIFAGTYRLAVHPGISPNGRSDFYHVRCFEDRVRILNLDFVDRIYPLTRLNEHLRGLPARVLQHGTHLVAAGLERLIQDWVWEQRKRLNTYAGNPVMSWVESAGFTDLWYNAGSNRYKGKQSDVPEIEPEYYEALSTTHAPWESDGPNDTNEWNLFRDIAIDRIGSLGNIYYLSELVDRWNIRVEAAFAPEEKLTDILREMKDSLGPKGVRAIKRLSYRGSKQNGASNSMSADETHE